MLWRNGSLPWDCVSFLDYAAERILLRKVGGGYIFLHRLLLDYFADLETKPGEASPGVGKQERRQPETRPSVSVEPIGAEEDLDVPTISLAPNRCVSFLIV